MVVFVPFERARVRAVRVCTLPIVGADGPFLEAAHGAATACRYSPPPGAYRDRLPPVFQHPGDVLCPERVQPPRGGKAEAEGTETVTDLLVELTGA